ncbi:MAG: hypothetical protein JF888_14990 [Candidatus Dormibacteraeota bacterium]|uniref:Uncharacterized protein n=1 Tax=Candidatus Dormiibacter inghamiae TaxID=3127013 RepID=A0A934KGV3_9BACT|nr:hypothetical protein [Candidatus Dormibacteraeota bacterium]MBJ7606901.1 hypothetical protein [Candidatus Dormibacteraeota bacterium]
MKPTEIANTDLVLLAMALAGAGEDFADIEDIAVQAFKLSPQRFGWRTKDYPSDKIVVQSVADLEGRHKSRLTMRGKDKMATRMLTAEGRKAAIEVATRITGHEFKDLSAVTMHFKGTGGDAPPPTPAERRRAQAELTELRRHQVFQVWLDSADDLPGVDRWKLLDALSCLPDAPAESVNQQIETLTALAEKWQGSDVTQFLHDLSALLDSGTSVRRG